MRCHVVLLLVVAIVGAGLLSGCPRPQPGEVAAGAPDPGEMAATPQEPEAGAEPVKVRFTYSNKTCYLPVIIAYEEGYYKEEGLQVEPKIVTGGIESAEAMVGAQADLGTMGDAPTAIALTKSEDIRVICNQALGTKMHSIVTHDAAGIKTPRDLEGKKVAVQLGSSTHGGFLMYCKKNGIDPDTINFVSLSPRDFPQAMVAKQVDVVVGSEPWPGNTVAECRECHEFANLGDVGSNFPLPILARKSFLDEHPGLAARVVQATQRACDLATSDPDKAAEILARASGVPVERERKNMEAYEWATALDEATVDGLRQMAQFLLEQKKIDRLPDFDTVIDRRGFEG